MNTISQLAKAAAAEKSSSLSLISAIANAAQAPSGKRLEGGMHGFVRGLGAEAGTTLGSLGGAGLGALGGMAAQALAKRFRLPISRNLVGAGALGGAGAGGVSGAIGGYQGAKSLFGNTSYEKASQVKEAGPLTWLARGAEGAAKFMASPIAKGVGKAWQTGMKYAPTATVGATAMALPAANELFAGAGKAVRGLTNDAFGWDGFGGVKWDPGRTAAESQMAQNDSTRIRRWLGRPIQSAMSALGISAADNAPRYNDAKYQERLQHARANNLPLPDQYDSANYDMGPQAQNDLDILHRYGALDLNTPEGQKRWENVTKYKWQQYGAKPPAAAAAPTKPINMQNMPEFLPRVAAGF